MRTADTNNQFTATTLVKNYKDDSIVQQWGRAIVTAAQWWQQHWQQLLCHLY